MLYDISWRGVALRWAYGIKQRRKQQDFAAVLGNATASCQLSEAH